jgi:multidrug efflux system membrane fusion protein
VVNEQRVVSVRKLKLGPTDNDRIAILEGLVAGDQVVTDGVDNLRDGATVEISSRSKSPAKP